MEVVGFAQIYATPGINSQSVGTASDPQYGGFVDANFKK